MEPATKMIRASSSAFAWGDLIFTDFNSGCLRHAFIRANGVDHPIDPKYPAIGKLNEDLHAADLTAAGVYFEREVECVREATTDVLLIGHTDFLVDGGTAIHELKSVSSTTSRREVFKYGHYKTENLAQIVCYMTEFRAPVGKLIYSFFDETDDPEHPWTRGEQRTFTVIVDDFGRIHVDGVPTKWTVHDMLAHQQQAANAVSAHYVPQRPQRWDAPFLSPCGLCRYKAVCLAHDEGHIEGGDAFVNAAKNI